MRARDLPNTSSGARGKLGPVQPCQDTTFILINHHFSQSNEPLPSAVLPKQSEAFDCTDTECPAMHQEGTNSLHHSRVGKHHSMADHVVAGIGDSPQQGAGNADCAGRSVLAAGEEARATVQQAIGGANPARQVVDVAQSDFVITSFGYKDSSITAY